MASELETPEEVKEATPEITKQQITYEPSFMEKFHETNKDSDLYYGKLSRVRQIYEKFLPVIQTDINQRLRYKSDDQELGEEVFTEQNLVRQDPLSMVPYFNEKLKTAGTDQGRGIILEAITFLKGQKPVHQLIRSIGLTFAATDHTKDMQDDEEDWIECQYRLNKFCKQPGRVSESLSFDQTTAKGVISSLIMDKDYRKNLFDMEVIATGIHCGKHHKKKNEICTVTYANESKDCDMEIISDFQYIMGGLDQYTPQ